MRNATSTIHDTHRGGDGIPRDGGGSDASAIDVGAGRAPAIGPWPRCASNDDAWPVRGAA